MPLPSASGNLVNRIAAGEVVERPASVVEELVDNNKRARMPVKAASTYRTTAVAPVRLIRVADDGEGHDAGGPRARGSSAEAISKFADDDTLASIRTLGFRGEALPSIGAVARLVDHHAAPERAACLDHRGRCRRQIRRQARSARRGHARRGARSVLRNAGAAEVSEARPHRGRSGPRSGAPARHEPARRRLHACRRGARAGQFRSDAARRDRTARPARRRARLGFSRQCGRDCRRARRAS